MLRSVEATIDAEGGVHLAEPVHVQAPCRAIVTIIDELEIPEAARLSEPALAQDWNRPEEDAAWAHLQRDR